jgi:NADPH-dependent F420 reductase
VRVAIVGGTGDFGFALAQRLGAAGEEVVIGSRDRGRAAEKAREAGVSEGLANEDAVRRADLVVLATRADAAVPTAAALAAAIGERPLLSVASELHFSAGGVRPDPDSRSLAERVQELVRGPVAAGLHSLAASSLARGPADADALVCGDDALAKELALELAAKIVAGRAFDAGPLASARALEGFTAVLVNLNRRYKGHASVRVIGLP